MDWTFFRSRAFLIFIGFMLLVGVASFAAVLVLPVWGDVVFAFVGGIALFPAILVTLERWG